jgi:putative ABC transport system substrate-binding protein
MRRRALLAIFVGAPAAASFAAQAEPMVRVGVLGPDEQPRFADLVTGLRAGLALHGLPAARLELVVRPVARGEVTAAESAARQLRQAHVTAIFAIGSEIARIAQRVAPEVPVVFITPGDPVRAGLVPSLARPGGSVTGVTFEFPELSAKRLELAREIVGSHLPIVVVVDPLDSSPQQALAAVRQAGQAFGMRLLEKPMRHAADLGEVVAALPGAAALLVIPGGAPSAYHAELMTAAHMAGVVTVFPARTARTRDAVVTYGARDVDVARDAARLIGRIASGARPGEVPVERPSRFELGINLATARTLGATIPPAVLARADEVIE